LIAKGLKNIETVFNLTDTEYYDLKANSEWKKEILHECNITKTRTKARNLKVLIKNSVVNRPIRNKKNTLLIKEFLLVKIGRL